MTDYLNKSFSVYPGAVGTQQYRDNYDRIFGKKAPDENCVTLPNGDCVGTGCMHDINKKDEPVEEPVPDTIPELKSPAEDIYCPEPGYTHDSKDCLAPRGCQGCR